MRNAVNHAIETPEVRTQKGKSPAGQIKLSAAYEGNQVLFEVDVDVDKGEIIALLGTNGAGKSTLLRTLVGETPPLGGSFAWGSNVEVGYYAQGHEELRRDRTVLAEVQDARPMTEEAARGYLGRRFQRRTRSFRRLSPGGDVAPYERHAITGAGRTKECDVMIRVLLAEDQAMVRGALAALLKREADIEVVAEIDRGDAVLAVALAHQPDVALLDIEMPGASGLDVAEELHKQLPACRVLILTTFGRPGYLRRALAGGGGPRPRDGSRRHRPRDAPPPVPRTARGRWWGGTGRDRSDRGRIRSR